MKREFQIIIVFLSVISSNFSHSQTSDSIFYKRLTVTSNMIDYLPSINLNTANINVGAEIYFKNQKSLAINFGLIESYGSSNKNLFSVPSINTNGFKIQIEGKHFIKKHKLFEPAILLFWLHLFQYKTQTLLNSGYYFAFHSSFQQTKTDRIGDYYPLDPFPVKIYTVYRNIYRIDLKFGYQCIKKCGLTIDYSIGFGGQYITSESKNSFGETTDFPWKKLFDNGSGFYPCLVYQFKVGWAF